MKIKFTRSEIEQLVEDLHLYTNDTFMESVSKYDDFALLNSYMEQTFMETEGGWIVKSGDFIRNIEYKMVDSVLGGVDYVHSAIDKQAAAAKRVQQYLKNTDIGQIITNKKFVVKSVPVTKVSEAVKKQAMKSAQEAAKHVKEAKAFDNWYKIQMSKANNALKKAQKMGAMQYADDSINFKRSYIKNMHDADKIAKMFKHAKVPKHKTSFSDVTKYLHEIFIKAVNHFFKFTKYWVKQALQTHPTLYKNAAKLYHPISKALASGHHVAALLYGGVVALAGTSALYYLVKLGVMAVKGLINMVKGFISKFNSNPQSAVSSLKGISKYKSIANKIKSARK